MSDLLAVGVTIGRTPPPGQYTGITPPAEVLNVSIPTERSPAESWSILIVN
jgi:hypothetical protein